MPGPPTARPPLGDHGLVEHATSPRGAAFHPATGPAEAEQIGRFLLAQGWAGLQLGDSLRRLAIEGVLTDELLWWVPGAAGEPRAVALLHRDRLSLLLTSRDEAGAARALIESHRDRLDRISTMEGQVDTSGLDEFEGFRRDLAVAPGLLAQITSGLITRPAGPQDVEQLHLIYGEVGWMRQDSAEDWRRRLREERCWVSELDGRVIAAARWTMSFGPWVEIGGVATHSQFRRRGAGAAVTRAAAAAALAEGRRVALRFGDPTLASLYYPLGFQPVGRERVFQRRR